MNAWINIKQVYFLGIGGIGMSALARYFRASGKSVAGYDRTPTDLTRQLEGEGINIHYSDSPELIPPSFRSATDTLVVFTPAIPPDHKEMGYFTALGNTLYKRSQVLGLITRNQRTIAVAGTHGKTTVSSMIAHLMTAAGPGCNALLGGIAKNFSSNLVLHDESEWMVTEADEFDRSFLQLYPYAAVVTAMDPDHLDIYGDERSMVEAFNQFIRQIDRQGWMITKTGLPVSRSAPPSRSYTYSLQGQADFHARNINTVHRRYHFDLVGPGLLVKDLSLEHPGLINVENAVASVATAVLAGLDHDRIRTALQGFTGIARRFDYHIQSDNIVYIDDYAHHPKEIEATLLSVRDLYPEKKITGIFQPHLYSRTRDLAEGFARSLSLLDTLILLDIYPARELPIPGVSSAMIFEGVTTRDKIMCNKEDLLQVIKEKQVEVLITLGAGDIDKLTGPLTQLLKERYGL